MRARRCRPARPWRPIPGGVAVVLAWWYVAHSSGQGWIQALGDVVAAALLVGLAGPWLVLRRVRVEVARSPADATAGVPADMVVTTSAPVRITPLSPPGPPTTAATVSLLASRRGVFDTVRLEVATAAPFGLQWWSRPVVLPLPVRLHVAPAAGPAGRFVPPRPDGDGTEAPTARAGAEGDLRAARPYRPGDARRLVHWPATAHSGELMVRELERAANRPVDLVVVLPGDPDAAEEEAARILATVVALLERSIPVVLTTTESDGPRTAAVLDRRDAGRRLAAAL